MRLVVVLGVVVVIGLFPAIAGTETVSRGYIGGAGGAVDGNGVGVIVCREPGDDTPPCTHLEALGVQSGFGGTRLRAGQPYASVIVTASDDAYGPEVAMLPCFLNPDGDTSCDQDDWRGSYQCGAQALVGAPFEGRFASVFTYSALVTADLDFCSASVGTIYGTFF